MASLAAAKRRRAPGLPNNNPLSSTPITANPQTPVPPAQISIPQAMSLIGSRLNKLETTLTTNMKEVENKFGQQDNYIVENIPDIDAINVAFEDINKRLLSVESGSSTNVDVKNVNSNINQLSSVKNLIDNLQKHIDTLKKEYNEKFDYVEQAVSSLDNTTKVVFIESNLNKLTNELNEMKSSFKSSNTSNDIIDEKFKLMENNISDLNNKLLNLNDTNHNDENKYNELLNRISALENTEIPDLTYLEEKVTEHVALLDKLEQKIYNNLRVDDVNLKITEIENKQSPQDNDNNNDENLEDGNSS
tara:strand:- start:3362 stop:4273 length:912 start_codon:yes stop_codon:yes gene_type:complete